MTLKETNPEGVALEAQIDPQDSETSYEFAIVWRAHDPSERGEPMPEDPRVQGGPIPAGAGPVAVSGFITGLQPDYIYWAEVIASNLAGKTRSSAQAFDYYYSGGYSTGIRGGPPYETEESPCAIESGDLAAQAAFAEAEAARHRQTLELEEQTAREAAALKQREQEAATARSVTPDPSCIVPALKGDTLRAAQRAIEKAHCRLGRIRWPRRRRGRLAIVSQSARHGERLRAGTPIAVTLGRTN